MSRESDLCGEAAGPLGLSFLALALPYHFYFPFLNVNLGPLPKNSGPNPMGFQG